MLRANQKNFGYHFSLEEKSNKTGNNTIIGTATNK